MAAAFIIAASAGMLLFMPTDRPAAAFGADDTPRRWERPTAPRIRVPTGEGVFLVYDAVKPPESRRKQAGLLAYWYDFESRDVYVFGRLLITRTDVGHALLNLDRDLWIDLTIVAGGIPALEEGLADAQWQQEDETAWEPGTRWTILELMGFDVPADIGATAVSGDYKPVTWCCLADEDCCGNVAAAGPTQPQPAPHGISADVLITLAYNATMCCYGDEPDHTRGGGAPPPRRPPPPPPPCGDPVCGCDRCCQGSSCCNSPDPCCDTSDPCCIENPRDRCCNDDNPCCGSPDPCCNINDPCCGNPNPCCNPDNPCCGNEVPCDEVCGDPCLCMTCDDEDPCTDDTCSDGV